MLETLRLVNQVLATASRFYRQAPAFMRGSLTTSLTLNGDFAYKARCWLWKGLKPFSAFCTFCKAPWIQGSLSSYCPKSTDHGSNRFLSDTACWILICCRKVSRACLTSFWYGNDLLSRIFITPSMISIEDPWWIIRFLTVDMERSFQWGGRIFFWIRHSNFQQ